MFLEPKTRGLGRSLVGGAPLNPQDAGGSLPAWLAR